MKTTTILKTVLAATLGVTALRMDGAAADRRSVIVLMKNGAPASAARFASPAAALRARAAGRPSALSLAADARNVKDLWIVNGYALDASADSIASLEKNPDVQVLENVEVKAPEVQILSGAGAGMENWGLAKIGAQTVWSAFGVTGRGVRIGHLDTGVDASHPDLQGKIAAWAEFDGSGNQVASQPHDSGIHGTHTAGILVGGSAGGAPIGVAPGAKLVSALVLNGNSGTLIQVLAGMEWVLDPDNNPLTDDGAQVLSMSLGASGQYQIFQDATDRLLAAGVLPVFAIGNSGAGQADAPGNCAGAVSVGATMYGDVIASFSGGGRITWNGRSYVKPEVSAPGYGIPSSIPGGRYQTMSGTSMATPHVAGAAALLLEANPALTVTRLSELLETTAVDLGAPGADDRFGAGRIDVAAAAAAATERSVIQGLASGDGQPVPASIRVMSAAGRTIQTVRADSATGRFQLSLAHGDYVLDASFGMARGVEKTISVAKGAVVNVSFSFSQSSSLENVLPYPNPFRPGRDQAVTFDGVPAGTSVAIYTLSGEKIAEAAGGNSGAVTWNGRNDRGESLASGPYLFVASRYDDQKGWENKKGMVAVLK